MGVVFHSTLPIHFAVVLIVNTTARAVVLKKSCSFEQIPMSFILLTLTFDISLFYNIFVTFFVVPLGVRESQLSTVTKD